MKANELMQGDFVLYEYNGEKFHARVVEIYRSSALVESVSKEYEPIEIEEDKLFPVAIIPEIMEKNGFIKRMSYSNYRWYLDGYDVITLNIYSERNKIWRMSIDTKRNENTIVYVTFVHQLQRALILCNIDKEIVL